MRKAFLDRVTYRPFIINLMNALILIALFLLAISELGKAVPFYSFAEGSS